jgi:hypothetical protein
MSIRTPPVRHMDTPAPVNPHQLRGKGARAT